MACKYLTTGAIGKRRAITSLAGNAPVARHAVRHGKHPRQTWLDARIKDFEGLSSKEAGVAKRRASGGYHCPGSLQK